MPKISEILAHTIDRTEGQLMTFHIFDLKDDKDCKYYAVAIEEDLAEFSCFSFHTY